MKSIFTRQGFCELNLKNEAHFSNSHPIACVKLHRKKTYSDASDEFG